MIWIKLGGGVALIIFALWAMISGGGEKPSGPDAHDRDMSNATDLSMID